MPPLGAFLWPQKFQAQFRHVSAFQRVSPSRRHIRQIQPRRSRKRGTQNDKGTWGTWGVTVEVVKGLNSMRWGSPGMFQWNIIGSTWRFSPMTNRLVGFYAWTTLRFHPSESATVIWPGSAGFFFFFLKPQRKVHMFGCWWEVVLVILRVCFCAFQSWDSGRCEEDPCLWPFKNISTVSNIYGIVWSTKFPLQVLVNG